MISEAIHPSNLPCPSDSPPQGLDKIVLPKPEPEGFFSGAVSAVSGAVTRLVSAAPSEQAVVGTVKGFIEDNLDPHMVEVLTGQGKSVVLALTSIVLAFFGFRVDCACYSEYVGARHRNEFKNVRKTYACTRAQTLNANTRARMYRHTCARTHAHTHSHTAGI
jgi:hypothetical protein